MIVLASAAASAQQQGGLRAQYQLGGEAYAGQPFLLAVVVEGLAEQPEPTAPAINVPGASITPMGVELRPAPTVIINGQRVDQGSGTWVLRYRMEVSKGGNYALPEVKVTQGSTQVTVQGGRLKVNDLPSSDDMAIEVLLPQRPVYVGETIPVDIAWILRKDPRDQSLSVPLLGLADSFTITVPPPANPRQVVSFPAGGRDLDLGYTQDTIERGGSQYTRLLFRVLVTPLKAGTIAIPPAQVVARLEVGMGRDAFGFPAARTELFRSSDEARTLDVRPLPETGKPPSFGGAVGSSFSIGVRASRSVVQLGEPVELEIAVKSDQRLDTVGLPPLDGPGMLPRAQFVVPADPPVGELAADGLTKTFKVAVQVVGADATAVPALAFSYFDPTRSAYQTIHSEPIALSVKGGSVVGAAQVVGGGKGSNGGSGGAGAGGAGAGGAPGDVSLVGVELALSAPGASGGPLSRSVLWMIVGLLYLVPLVVFGARAWRTRTASQREEASEVKTALRALRDEIERAHKIAARDAAVSLPRAMRTAAKALGRTVDEKLVERIENAGFAPTAGADPLPSELRNELADVADAWAHGARSEGGGGGGRNAAGKAGAVAVLVALATLAIPEPARAEDAGVRAARADYQAALDAGDPQIRQRNFAAASAAFAKVARSSRSAALYADWGNAALGAGDVGGAALAYRRALSLDSDESRARRNLTWLRSRMPEGMRPTGGGATETLFFFHSSWSRDQRLVVGAAAFALMVLLFVPWGGKRRPWMVAVAIAPALTWVAMTVSLVVEDRHSADAVVMQASILRSADSAGAPPRLSSQLPAGVEVVIVERRDAWTQIRLPSGTTGWLPAGTVERVNL
ncbi:MAG TPA: SH3 domain-containing protein [Kofleriaceae bacterium]|nr:SH3 domain-containing protein [Kofleriaceae bacterium]